VGAGGSQNARNTRASFKENQMPAVVDKELCDACKSCVEVCPSDAVTVDEKAVVNVDDCIDCKACEDACTNGAIKVES
jgi:NAD-dependent dihydropyrimidine dehydrogenase PreA subunit